MVVVAVVAGIAVVVVVDGSRVICCKFIVDVPLKHVDGLVHLGCSKGNVGKVQSGGCSVMWDVASFVDVHCCRLDAGVPCGTICFNSDGAVGVEDCALVVGGIITAVVAGGLVGFTFEHGVRERQVTNRLP